MRPPRGSGSLHPPSADRLWPLRSTFPKEHGRSRRNAVRGPFVAALKSVMIGFHTHQALWIPAEALPALRRHPVNPIRWPPPSRSCMTRLFLNSWARFADRHIVPRRLAPCLLLMIGAALILLGLVLSSVTTLHGPGAASFLNVRQAEAGAQIKAWLPAGCPVWTCLLVAAGLMAYQTLRYVAQ
eukprot:gene9719-1748_t